MLPDNAFHFFLIGLLSHKLLIINKELHLARMPTAVHLPGEQRRGCAEGSEIHEWIFSQGHEEMIPGSGEM